MDDVAIPPLAPRLMIKRMPDTGGAPAYAIHDPLSNSYHKLDWVTFECVSRFHRAQSISALLSLLREETTITAKAEDIRDIIHYLSANGLLANGPGRMTRPMQADKGVSLWKKILHGYLYFSIPLFTPQKFLERTLPLVRGIFSDYMIIAMLCFTLVMVLTTLPRIDEFFATFAAMSSFTFIFLSLCVFALLKIIHEAAHAYAAVKNGVFVPHMGVSFIVLYPVLYTETTGGWGLRSRRARLEIGLAGIVIELCLAGIFLALWHILPSGGLGQSLCFVAVCVAVAGSLAINLNPLMRFDGYYILSDLTGFDNLQDRSLAFARHHLRKTLFNLPDEVPEILPQAQENFLRAFGYTLLVFRFFLFVGIAILVYHLFVQPIGLLLMVVELLFFIGFPVWRELKIWHSRRKDIFARRRVAFPLALCGLFLLFLIIPWRGSVVVPATLHAAREQAVYAPDISIVRNIRVENGSLVAEGDILIELESPDLAFRIREVEYKIRTLTLLKDQAFLNPTDTPAPSAAQLDAAMLELSYLEKKKEGLSIRAAFKGRITDLASDLVGQTVTPRERLFSLVDPSSAAVTGYAAGEERDRIEAGAKATFIGFDGLTVNTGFVVQDVAQTGSAVLPRPELSARHGGPVAADETGPAELTARRPLYQISASGEGSAPIIATGGYLILEARTRPILLLWLETVLEVIRREARLGS